MDFPPEYAKQLIARTQKLELIRINRRKLLQQVDIAVNKMVLTGESSTRGSWETYRNALLAITDPYKNHVLDPNHAAALDALVVKNLSWPEAPSA